MNVRIESNLDQAHCDDCDNAPLTMVVVSGKHSEKENNLWLCRRCFKKLHSLELPTATVKENE